MQHNKYLEKDTQVINSYIDKMTIDNYQEILSDIYKYVKKVCPPYFEKDDENIDYEYLKLSILLAEEKVKSQKVLDVPIYFDLSEKKDNVIEQIIYDTRKYLLEEHKYIGYRNGLIDINFTDDCKKASDYIKHMCHLNNIWCHVMKISPGYDDLYYLFNGSGNHFANIIKYENKYYLIDTTYSQFFYSKRNNIDRLGILGISGCGIGAFMLMNEERKNIATKIIRDGYIELNEEIFKNYMDGFTLSFRNGLYYEKTDNFSYTTKYTLDDYINFLIGSDNQVNYEGEENLGFQRRLLKNYNLNFRR